jgi:opacity protein-like surface antigen
MYITLALIPAVLTSGGTIEREDLALGSYPATLSTSVPPVALPQAAGRDGIFLELAGGLVTTTDSNGPGEEIDFDEGYGVFVGVGKRIAGVPNQTGFDLMLEGFFTDQDVSDSGTLQAFSDVTVGGGLVSGIADFAVTDRLSVFGGAGIGVSWVDVGTQSDSISDFDDDDGALLTWQARAGARLRFSPTTSGFIGYRFLNIDDNQIDDGLGGSSFALQTEQHVAEVGLRFGPAGF